MKSKLATSPLETNSVKTNLTLDALVQALQETPPNINGGATLQMLANQLGFPKKAVHAVTIDGFRQRTVSCHVDQNPKLTFAQACKKPLRYFVAATQYLNQ